MNEEKKEELLVTPPQPPDLSMLLAQMAQFNPEEIKKESEMFMREVLTRLRNCETLLIAIAKAVGLTVK